MRYFFNKDYAFLQFGSISISIIFINQFSGWPVLRFWNISGIDSGFNRFNDLSIVLNAAECYPIYGNKVYLENFHCGNYLYGTFLLKLVEFLNVRHINIYILGLLLAIFLVISTIYFTSHALRKGHLAFVLLIFFAPPFHLMVQRGHIDIVIFSIVSLSLYLFRKKYNYSAILLLFLTVLFKFYTLPLLLYFSLSKRSRSFRFFSITLFICSLFLIRQDLAVTPVKVGQLYTGRIWGLFGWRTIVDRLNETATIQLNNFQSSFLSLLIFTIAYFIIYNLLKYFLFTNDVSFQNSKNTTLHEEFYALSLVFLTCFFAGTNYDFRLYFGVIAGIVFMRISQLSRRVSALFMALLLLISWLSFESGGLEIFGDVFVLILVVVYLEYWRINFVRGRFNFRVKIKTLIEKNIDFFEIV
jgi:hypothetical protein